MPLTEKDPSATIDRGFDWTSWLGADTITSSDWIVPTGLTRVSQSNTTKTTSVWLSGGTVDTLYRLTNRITTTGGREDERSLHIKIVER